MQVAGAGAAFSSLGPWSTITSRSTCTRSPSKSRVRVCGDDRAQREMLSRNRDGESIIMRQRRGHLTEYLCELRRPNIARDDDDDDDDEINIFIVVLRPVTAYVTTACIYNMGGLSTKTI